MPTGGVRILVMLRLIWQNELGVVANECIGVSQVGVRAESPRGIEFESCGWGVCCFGEWFNGILAEWVDWGCARL